MTEKKPYEPATSPLAALGRFTAARIALGRCGTGLPTAAHLDFAEAHAVARDAVHAGFDTHALAEKLRTAGLDCLEVESEARDRATYLRRPDLGRRLSRDSRERLERFAPTRCPDVVIVIADGLSAQAANSHAAEVAIAVSRQLLPALHCAPVVLAHGGRVALSDPIGEALGARLALVLIGERPGLSAADSLGAYLTFGPRTGRTDADRNCVSNIRLGGLLPDTAARKILRLTLRSLELGFSGTRLKDEDPIEANGADRLAGIPGD